MPSFFLLICSSLFKVYIQPFDKTINTMGKREEEKKRRANMREGLDMTKREKNAKKQVRGVDERRYLKKKDGPGRAPTAIS